MRNSGVYDKKDKVYSVTKTDDRAVKDYAKELSKVVILDAKTEKYLFNRYKKFGDIKARNKLVESGLRFVIKIAQAYSRDLERHKHLISAGNEGLLVAVDRFDPTRGTRFLSYATWWVTLYIREELHRSPVVTIPMWRKKSLRKLNEARALTMEQHGREPTKAELQHHTGLSQHQLDGLIQETYEVVPLDLEISTTLEAPAERTDARVMNASATRLVQYLISQLPVRDAFVCRAYFGFLSDPPMSLKQVASVLGISSERVRQIKMEALGTLKKYLELLNVRSTDDAFDD